MDTLDRVCIALGSLGVVLLVAASILYVQLTKEEARMAEDPAARNPFKMGLERNTANQVALTPHGFLSRATYVHPECTAWRMKAAVVPMR